MFRTGTREYTKRPPANCRRARAAWDRLAEDGPIEWMTLLDGYWGACRADGSIDEIENLYTLEDRKR